jgi:hypothetical protein
LKGDILTSSVKTQYQLNEAGEYIINDYNSTKLFSSFFPGVAGKTGIPMWLFYVNRGQCVCSMGIEDKEHPIMEFLPANRAYQLAASQGFRTFIKLSSADSNTLYEPFQNHLRDRQVKRIQRMVISPASLKLEEDNLTLGLKFTVEYFNVPQDNYAGLVRKLSIENLNSDPVSLEGLDGLPLIIPYGVNNIMLKNMRRLVEAFVEVSNYEHGVPFFRGKVEPADRPDVVLIKKGNFYLGFEEGESANKLIRPIVDPKKIFGNQSDYSYPEKFLSDSTEEMYKEQILENRLPCAMGLFKTKIAPGKTYTYTSIIGHASSTDSLNAMVPVISKKDYVNNKAETNQQLIEALTQNNFICSQEALLDQYTRQNFLDNTLRGGFPHTLKGNKSSACLHLYSRKHGDLERDYNDYRLAPTHYSQGNGNFRDINQNRRCDLFFNPDIQEDNVEQFYNLIQLDGFNPLVTKETRFKATNQERLQSILSANLSANQLQPLMEYLQDPFTPGELAVFLENEQIKPDSDSELFFADLLGVCDKVHDTDYGEGYWTDHWTYNLDLLENYLAVYPEKLHYLLFEKNTFSFFDNPHLVLPRKDKYVLWEGKAMQLDAVTFDEDKEDLISQRQEDPNRVRTSNGHGKIYKTTLINSLLCLIINKMASLDPEGVGVELEAGKPNWYDALNGLPGLIGSSLSETLEIKRHILFLLEAFAAPDMLEEDWMVFEELYEFMRSISKLLDSQLSPFDYWDKATTVKEIYREKTRLGISGFERVLSLAEVKDFFKACLKKLEAGIEKAWDKEQNVISTYFINEVVDYHLIEETDLIGGKRQKVNTKGMPCFSAGKFKQIPLPLFLEGPVHYLRSKPGLEKARDLAASIEKSALFDQKLKMFKVNAPLGDQVMEIGRARVFSPGWFENESIWLHMEYKYMLELLRNDLHTEFYQNFKNVFVPFFKPEIYGRSILENSSFIVSSANPDPSIHGNGFVARLSGATAEFIHILMQMTVGANPFDINQAGELQLNLQPALPGWLFTREKRICHLQLNDTWQDVEFPAHTFSFMFLGSILISYQNTALADSFGKAGVVPKSWKVFDLDGNQRSFYGDSLSGDIVFQIRDRKISRIDIELG